MTTTSKAMSLKAKINNYAKKHGIAAQVVLQNYMFERLLARIAASDYRDKFVIKGGVLISSIVGLDTRSTMDLDTTLRGMPLTEQALSEAFRAISAIDLGDGVAFFPVSTHPIRKNDVYGGYCLRIDATYETMVTALSIDISTGDVITPDAVRHSFHGVFDDSVNITLWSYNIETVLAEKAQAILSLQTFSTRPRDYYDVYVLTKTQNYDRQVFEEALAATAEHRGMTGLISDRAGIVASIEESEDLQDMWRKYQRRFPYARGISYDDVIDALRDLLGLADRASTAML